MQQTHQLASVAQEGVCTANRSCADGCNDSCWWSGLAATAAHNAACCLQETCMQGLTSVMMAPLRL
jgi:hypothetical protein